MEAVGMNGDIILPNQIHSYLRVDPDGKKFMFIVDECFEMLMAASMTPLDAGALPGIFTVGEKHKVILSTGHYSQAYKEFLLRRYPSIKLDYCI